MANHILSNEQKLDAIYQLLKKQEDRERRKVWVRLARWLIIVFIIYYISIHPIETGEQVAKVMRPLIIENMKWMMDYEKSGFFEDLKKALKENQTPQP